MMANEALLIQMLSIESWLRYFSTTAGNFGTLADVVGLFIWPIKIIGKFLDETADVATEIDDQGRVPANDLIIAGCGLLAEDAANRLVQANRTNFGSHQDPGVEMDNRPAVRALTFVLNNKNWLAFARHYTGDQRVDAKEVVLASRDRYSADRPGVWWTNLNAGMVGSPGRWAQRLAKSDRESHSGWKGAPSVDDVRDKTAAARGLLGVDFLVAVRRARANTLTSSQIGMAVASNSPTGSSEMVERLEADQLTALAKAWVSFERPRRSLANDNTASSLWRNDSAKEYGSLFSPYWQARLADLTPTEKAGLMTAMGMLPDKAIYTPGGQP